MCATELKEINWDYTIASEFYQDCLEYLFCAQSKRHVFALTFAMLHWTILLRFEAGVHGIELLRVFIPLNIR